MERELNGAEYKLISMRVQLKQIICAVISPHEINYENIVTVLRTLFKINLFVANLSDIDLLTKNSFIKPNF